MGSDFTEPEPSVSVWQRLDGKLAPEVFHVPWICAASSQAERWPQIDAEIVTVLEQRLLSTPWANHLALVSVVMAARNQGTPEIVEVITRLHWHWISSLRTLRGIDMENWRPENALSAFVGDPIDPARDMQQRTTFLRCYSAASWHVRQWLVTLPYTQQKQYAPFCLPPLPLHDAGWRGLSGQVALLDPASPLFAPTEHCQMTSSRARDMLLARTPFSLEQIQALLQAAIRSPSSARDLALLGLLLETGMYVSELATVTWQDVFLEGPVSSIWLPGRKGASPRRLVLSAQMRDALLRYQASLAQMVPTMPTQAASGKLQPTEQRHGSLWRNHQGASLSASAIHRILYGLAQESGMLQTTGSIAQRLRATCSQAFITKAPGDLAGLATLLGISLQTVMRAQLYSNLEVLGRFLGWCIPPAQYLRYNRLNPPAYFSRLNGFGSDAGT